MGGVGRPFDAMRRGEGDRTRRVGLHVGDVEGDVGGARADRGCDVGQVRLRRESGKWRCEEGWSMARGGVRDLMGKTSRRRLEA